MYNCIVFNIWGIIMQSFFSSLKFYITKQTSIIFLLFLSTSALSGTVVSGVTVNVSSTNVVTVSGGGSQYPGGVGNGGLKTYLNGWSVTAGTITWRDTNNTLTLTMDSSGVNVLNAGGIANNNGNKTGSVTLAGNTTLGAHLRATYGVGSSAFNETVAAGTANFNVTGNVNIAALPGVNPDIQVTMTESVNPVTAGSGASNLTHVVTAENITTNAATGVVVTLSSMLPAGTTLVSGTPSAGTTFAGSTWTIGALGANSSATLTLVYTVGSSTTNGSSVSNTATLTAITETDDDNNNNSASQNTTVQAVSDLSITKTDGVTSAIPGNSVVYTIVANNAGPSDDPAASLNDNFPAGLTCTYTSISAGGATGNTNGSGNLAETLNMPNGSSVTYMANCAIDPGSTATLSNTATITASGTDLTPANNSATDNNTILTPQADLAITKTDGVTSAIPGNSVTYTIVASNAGPSNSPGVSIVDNFPASLSCTYTSSSIGAMGNTLVGAGNINDTLGLPIGSSVTYIAVCAIDSAATGTLSNTASIIESTATDLNPANNNATDNDTVLAPQADLSITKTDGVTSAIPGNSLTYTIVASNAGPSDDPSVTVADTFPADLTCTYTSVAAGGATGNTAAGAGDLAETLSMPSGSSVTYTATCAIDSAATGTLSNTATITASVTDSTPGNNSATDADTVLNPDADLSIVMTSPPANITTPDIFTYVIDVSNAGPSDATNVIVTDTLDVSFLSLETIGCVEDPNGYPNCNLGNLAPGEMASYSISFSLGSVSGDITNSVSVASDSSDSTVANNEDASVISGSIRVIPTLSQWGLIVLFLLILSISYQHKSRKKSL
jgi:uncharacterized repeat protein (TIGR01451 family)